MSAKIDAVIFAEELSNTGNKVKAYYAAGGTAKDAKQAAQQVMKRTDVQEAIKAIQSNTLQNIQNCTLTHLDRFMSGEYHDLEPKDKGAFLIKMLEKTGMSAPKRLEVNDNSKGDPVEQIIQALKTDDNLAKLFGGTTQEAVAEQPRIDSEAVEVDSEPEV